MKPAPDSVAFVVVSCDKYADLWPPFFHCLRKYWQDCPYRVYLITNFEDYDSQDVTVIKVGEDRSYSDNLRAALPHIKEPWAILWLEDIFLSAPVDTARLKSMIKEAQSIPVGYLKLSPDLPLSYDERSRHGIGPIPKGVRYRSAVGLSLYKLSTLEKLLLPGASAWDLDTSTVSDGLDEPFYALTNQAARRPPIPQVNGVIKGRWYGPAITHLKREGLSQVLKGRKRLGLMGSLYILGFKLHNRALRTMKRHWY